MQVETVGEWILVSKIDDSGGNGIVWQAKNTSGDTAALKILRPFNSLAKSEKRRQRFLNEIAALEYIQQRKIPRVMQILDHGFTDEGHPWYAMPIAKSLDLRGNGVEETIRGMMDVADTIAVLHEIGMEHRDIKPNNLLILNNEIVVSDFGLARMVGDEHFTATGERVGSMGYTASECVGKSDEPRFGCDAYALGKTTWVFLTGADRPPNGELRSPNDDLNNFELLTDQVDIALVQDLIFSATERDPGDRPTARQFRDGLSAALSPKVTTMPKMSSSPAARARALFGNNAARNKRDRCEIGSCRRCGWVMAILVGWSKSQG